MYDPYTVRTLAVVSYNHRSILTTRIRDTTDGAN